MSYETKYKHIFKDTAGDGWELHLKKDGYSGSEYTLDGGSSPVKILDPNEGGDKLVPIRGTELKSSLFIDTTAAYDFKADFWGITDREWQAVLYKTAASTYLAECEITNLNITNNTVDAEGEIAMTNTGGLVTNPTCDLIVNIWVFPTSGSITLTIYVTPKNEDNNSPNRISLGSVQVLSTDSNEDVIDKIAALSNFSKVTAIKVLYTQTTYSSVIDSSWGLKITYWESYTPADPWGRKSAYRSLSNGFTGATERQWIQVDLISKRVNLSTPDVVNLAKYYYETGETTSSIAEAISLQINNKIAYNVYYPTTGELMDVTFGAISSSDLITITLEDIGTKGNYFVIKSTFENDTYIRVHKRTGSSYAWIDTDFAGGDAAGDFFKIEVDQGSGNAEIASVLAYTTDTEQTIIARLVEYINENYGIYTASIDSVNDAKLLILSDNAATWTYKFSTDGGSTVTPSTDTAFAASSSNIIKWIGWVIPGIYSQPHQAGIVRQNISAVDGLGDLKNFDFEVQDMSPFEKLSFMEIISYALDKTGFNLDIYEAFDLWHLNADGDVSPLTQTYQDTSRLNGVNCYDVLSEIITLLKATLCQLNGHWDILPIDQQSGNYSCRVFGSDGIFKDTYGRSGFIKDVGGVNRDNIFMDKSANIQFEAGYRKVIIKQDYGFVAQMVKFPSFISINNNKSNLEYPWGWTYDEVVQTSFLGEIFLDSNGYLRLNSNVAHASTRFYIRQAIEISSVEVEGLDTSQYELKVTFKQDLNAATDTDIQILLKNNTETVIWYLQDDPNLPIASTEKTVNILTNETNSVKTLSIKFDYPDYSSFDVEPSTLYIDIYQPTSGYVLIKSVELAVNTIALSGKRISSYYSNLVSDLSSKVYDETLLLGDIPDLPNAMQVYKNALYYYNTAYQQLLTSSWVEDPDTPVDQKPLIDHIRKFWLDSYPTSIILLTANIYGDIWLRDIIKDKSNSDKLFMLIGGERDIKKRTTIGEWQEINIDVSGNTLVEATEMFSEDSSGSNTYTQTPGSGSEAPDVDLSNYYIKSEVDSKIIGVKGTFIGSDLTNREIVLTHNLANEFVILYLYDKNNQMLGQESFEIDTGGNVNSLTLTVHMPVSPTDEFTYRIL